MRTPESHARTATLQRSRSGGLAAIGQRLAATFAPLWRGLNLDGRLRLARPWAPTLGILALALALLFPARWLLYLAYVYLLITAGAYLWARTVGPRLSLSRRLRTTWAQVGDELEENWELRNDAPLPLLWLAINDESRLPGYNARRIAAADPGERQSWRTLARCARRGRYRLGPHTAATGDPLGIFRYTWQQPAHQELVVYPPLVRLPALAMPSGSRGGLAQADLLQIFATPSVGGLRAYAPGDPPSRIHWPYVARYGELFVKEFDQERSGALWIVLDMAAVAYASASSGAAQVTPSGTAPSTSYAQSSVAGAALTEYQAPDLAELALTIAGSLAAQALADGRQVGLLCDDGQRRLVAPGTGSRQLWRIMAALVECEPHGATSLAELLRAHGELAGGAIAIVSADLSSGWLPALAERAHGRAGSGAMALLVAEHAASAGPCQSLLARHAIAGKVFTRDISLPLVNPPHRRVTARVSPLGRVREVR
jgi:uncharacterized protein (DUF58 family)